MARSMCQDSISTLVQVLGAQVWSPRVVQGGLVASCCAVLYGLYGLFWSAIGFLWASVPSDCVRFQHGSWTLMAWSMYGDHVSMVVWPQVSLVKAQTTLQSKLVSGCLAILTCCCFLFFLSILMCMWVCCVVLCMITLILCVIFILMSWVRLRCIFISLYWTMGWGMFWG